MNEYINPCLFCGGNRDEPDHLQHCDGRQGGRPEPPARVYAFHKIPAVSREAFERYHAENPEIYVKLVEFSLQAARAGARHFGIRMIYERLRWYTRIEARNDIFKLNDHYHAFYARKLMNEYPELAGMFETRSSKADEEVSA